MSLDTALFLVNRNGTTYKVNGADIGTKIRDNDCVLVQRGADTFKVSYNNNFNRISDSDLLLAYQNGSNYRVTGANFKNLFATAPVINYFRCNPSTIEYGSTYAVEWSVSYADVVNVKHQDGRVLSTSHSGTASYSSSTPGTSTFSLEVTGNDGVTQTRQASVITQDPPLPTNYLSGPSSSTYGSLYTLNYTQYNHTYGQLGNLKVYDSSGSVNFRMYPYRDSSYAHWFTSTNSYGEVTSTHSVFVPGKSVSPVSITGVPSGTIRKGEEFTVYANWHDSGTLRNVSFTWELEAGIDSGFANFNNVGAGRPGQFTSTEQNPRVYINNNTHMNNGNPISAPPGRLPDGIKLKLTVKNKDNNETGTTSVMFKTYPR